MEVQPQGAAPSFVGLPTFMMLPFAQTPAEMRRLGAEIAVMGAPVDATATHRPGSRFGPRSTRAASSLVWKGAYDFQQDVRPFREIAVVDAGDANSVPGDIITSHQYIHDKVAEVLSANAIPLVMGGEHSISLPIATALAEKHGPGSFGILHFDAHNDAAPNNFGLPISHATQFRRLIENGVVKPGDFVQIGMRGYWPNRSAYQWILEQGLRPHNMDEIIRDGFNAVLERCIAEGREGPEKLYISVDIDVLDPAFAPGVCAPEPGGIDSTQLLYALRRFSQEFEVIGMDVCEVAPAYDVSELTATVAHRCLSEVITGVARRRSHLEGGE